MPKKGTIAIVLGALITGAVLLFSRKAKAVAPPPPPPGLANLYGKITDGITGNPIEGALIALNGLTVYTDSSGDYTFEDLTPGSYAGSILKEGYETAYF